MKKQSPKLIIMLVVSVLMIPIFQYESKACNIAAVSASASSTGRPFIWKNRDHAISYRHEVLYKPAVKSTVGGYLVLMGETMFNGSANPTAVCTGGSNESGFAIANTTCIDLNNDPLDMYNVNPDLMVKALQECRTLQEFEALSGRFTQIWSGKNISGIFAVIDAYGGAAIYEMWTNGNGRSIMWRKFNVDSGNVTDETGKAFTDIKYTQTTGFNNRTNSNHTRGWIDIASDTPRELRARQLFTSMKNSNTLSPRNLMRIVSKDVCGGTPSDYFYNPADSSQIISNNWNTTIDSYLNPNRGGELYTRYAISRYQTTMGLVIEGAATPEDAKLTTMWVSLGEPSLSVFVPFFPYAHQVSKYASDDSHSNSGYYWDGNSSTQNSEDSSFLNLLFDCVEANPFSSSNYSDLNNIYKNISLYKNNGSGNYLDTSDRNNGDWYIWPITYKMDTTINYPRLMTLQKWTFPLEDSVFNNTDAYISVLKSHPELITPEALAEYSDYCNGYVYKNYSHQSASYIAWNHALPVVADDPVDPIDPTDPGTDPIITDPIGTDPIITNPPVVVVNPDVLLFNNGLSDINFPLDGVLSITFSKDINPATINIYTVYLYVGNMRVEGSVAYDAATRTASFTPVLPLDNSTLYKITASSNIKDTSGRYLTVNKSWKFTTIAIAETNPVIPELDDSAAYNSDNTADTGGSGCGLSAQASTMKSGSGKNLSGLINLLVTMLFPLCLIRIQRMRKKMSTRRAGI